MVIRTLLLTVFSISFFSTNLFTQSWTKIKHSSFDKRNKVQSVFPSKFKVYKLDFTHIEQHLPQKNTSNNIILPLPNGTLETFSIIRKDVFHPELAAKYPGIRSYSGQSVEHPNYRVKLSYSPKGIDVMITGTPNGDIFIDQLYDNDASHYATYFKADYSSTSHFNCDEHSDEIITTKSNSLRYGDCILRTYRLALACTGEYATYHGGTKESVLAEFNTAINRVNGIYERELGVTFQLIPNTDTLIFLNESLDPYTNNDGSTMLNQNQTTITELIGVENYDIGHVFSTKGGGIASLRVVCRDSRKARGVTGLEKPEADPFYIDYVCHEIGHQFGASHTFNNDCDGHISKSSAFEPGSGSTIMSYAGVCEPNIYSNSQAFFHTSSLEKMINFITGGKGLCATTTETANSSPSIRLRDDSLVIPHSTPFVLSVSGEDSDSADILTYTWEQLDKEIAPMPPKDTSRFGPLFKSNFPTTDTFRIFPSLTSILDTTQSIWEVLPSVGRTLHFRVTVRDNALTGCHNYEDIVLSVADSIGAFFVHTPDSTWTAGEETTITWDVANTYKAPVNCSNVDILLSTTEHREFNTVIAKNISNTGTYTFVVPDTLTDSARILIKASNSIFFNICERSFQIIEKEEEEIIPVSFIARATPPSCYGDTDGTIVVKPKNGTSPYKYQLNEDSIQTSNTFENLIAGNYTIKVIDAQNDTSEQQINLVQPDSLSLRIDTTMNSAIVQVTGGTFPYTFSLSNGIFQTLSTFTELVDGGYIVEITDIKGCTISGDFMIGNIVSNTQNIDNGFEIYPNPFTSTIHINGNIDSKNVEIINSQGQSIREIPYAKTIDLSHLPNGVYFVQLHTIKGISTRRVSKL